MTDPAEKAASKICKRLVENLPEIYELLEKQEKPGFIEDIREAYNEAPIEGEAEDIVEILASDSTQAISKALAQKAARIIKAQAEEIRALKDSNRSLVAANEDYIDALREKEE